MTVHAGGSARFAITAAVLLLGLIAPVAVRAAEGKTIVTLTFDDGYEDNYTKAFPVLRAHKMHGTFYTITGYNGVYKGFMTVPQLHALYNAGNEIADHTVLHPHLTQISTPEASREVCDSRDTLLNWGFPVTDFAYPYTAYNPALQGIARSCGYNSARQDGDLASPYACRWGCPVAETIPPRDPYAIRAPESIEDNWSVADMESLVTQAENGGGGWAVLVFHHICSRRRCDPYSVTPAHFNALLTWLQTQHVAVETIAQVIGGPVQPPVSAPQVSPAPSGTNGVVNASLETDDPYHRGTPDCWSATVDAGTSARFAETSTAHTGSVGETITTKSHSRGNATLMIKQDLGECAPSAVPGDSYIVSGWYRSTVRTRFVFWYRDPDGGWRYWTQSPPFARASSWAHATWATPAAPADATGLSFGMNIEAVGTLTTDDYSLADSGGPPTTPTVFLGTPAAGTRLAGPVMFTANASSPVGISRVDFLVNGVVVATSTSAPYTATWHSTTVGDGPVTVTARATDTAGRQATTAGEAATVSNASRRHGNLLTNAFLNANTRGGSTPRCWQERNLGTNTAIWAYTRGAHHGNATENVTISSYTSGDRKLVTAQGTSACSPRVTPGTAYTLGASYRSSRPTHILAYYRNSSGGWVYWTQSPVFTASSAWTRAAWTTPAVPAGATALSFGLNLAAAGSLTTTSYTMTGH